jgi:hypothetical protein
MNPMNQISLHRDLPLPTAADPVPTLTCMALHSRLICGLPKEVARTLTQDDLPALRVYWEEAKRLLQPASTTAIVKHLTRLSWHYPQPDLPQEALVSRWGDCIEDFKDIPEDLIDAACILYRNSTAQFAPTPGRLKEMIGGENYWGRARQLYERRARQLIEILENRLGSTD